MRKKATACNYKVYFIKVYPVIAKEAAVERYSEVVFYDPRGGRLHNIAAGESRRQKMQLKNSL